MLSVRDEDKNKSELIEELQRLRQRVADLEAGTKLLETGPAQDYYRLVELSPETIAIHQKGILKYLNRAGMELIGATSLEQVIGKPLLDFVHPDYRELVMARARQTQEQGQPARRQQEKFVRLNGEVIDVEVVAVPIIYLNQPATQVVVRDITERKRLEEILRHSEAQLRLITDILPALISYIGTDQRYRFVNQGYEEWLGVKREELIGTGLWEVMGGAAYEIIQPHIETILKGEQPQVRFESKITYPDGITRYVEINYVADKNSQGVLEGFVVLVSDISERRRSEEKQKFLAQASTILSSSLEYETTLQNIAHLITPFLADWCTIDVKTEDGTIRSLGAAHNDPTRQALVEELSRRYWSEFRTEDQILPRVQRSGEALMVAEIPPDLLERPNYQPEHRQLLRQLGIQSALFVPLKIREEVLGSIMFIRADLNRKYTQEDLELAQELARRATQAVENARLYREAQNAIKDREEFLSVAAHELKTPITGLKGFTQILLRRMQKGQAFDPLRTSRDLNAINNQADKLTHLINQLLDISRIELGKLVLEPHYTDLIPLVEGVIAQAQVETTNHSLNLTVPGDPLIVLADPLRFEQVVVNLVNNAIKYSPEGGPVEVELKQASADTICLSVRDWGLGIPPEYRGNIFDRFYQAHQRAHLGGMGLGLYITRQIVELHGGKIEVSFPTEGGTRFVVTLPVRAEPKS